MSIVDRGRGTPVVMIPGIQGRWKWMAPAVDALASRCRVITFSLCDEPGSGFPMSPERGMENYLTQLEEVFERTGLTRAVLVGVSYAGPIATEFAVRHPDRVRALVLVSALPTDWTPDARARFYLRAPLLLSPVFVVDASLRAARELRAALPRLVDRLRFSIAQVGRVIRTFPAPWRMASRIRWMLAFRFSDPSAVRCPVLVITGEPGLDRVVPPEQTRRYVQAIAGAKHMTIPRTGHLGLLTRAATFAAAVCEFADEHIVDARRASA